MFSKRNLYFPHISLVDFINWNQCDAKKRRILAPIIGTFENVTENSIQKFDLSGNGGFVVMQNSCRKNPHYSQCICISNRCINQFKPTKNAIWHWFAKRKKIATDYHRFKWLQFAILVFLIPKEKSRINNKCQNI